MACTDSSRTADQALILSEGRTLRAFSAILSTTGFRSLRPLRQRCAADEHRPGAGHAVFSNGLAPLGRVRDGGRSIQPQGCYVRDRARCSHRAVHGRLCPWMAGKFRLLAARRRPGNPAGRTPQRAGAARSRGKSTQADNAAEPSMIDIPLRTAVVSPGSEGRQPLG